MDLRCLRMKNGKGKSIDANITIKRYISILTFFRTLKK